MGSKTKSLIVLLFAGLTAACTPTIKVAVAPITISAKLDADVMLRFDEMEELPMEEGPMDEAPAPSGA